MQPNETNDVRTLPYATPRPRRPLWVKMGLWGLPNRATAWAFVWICLGVAGFSAVRGFTDPLWFWGVGMASAAFWYWASIRWVDNQDGWA
jgi:hypothetical protein